MPPPRPPNLTTPLGPLTLELKRDCRDDAVVGGFGQYVSHWARDAADGAQAELATRLQRIAEAFDGYAGQTPDARRELCEKTIKALGMYRERFGAPARREKPAQIGAESSVQFIKGVGPKRADILAELGIRTVADLLRHYPARHEDRRVLPKLAELTHRQTATVRVTVTGPGEVRATKPREVAEVPVTDGATEAKLVWFNQPYRAEQFKEDTQVLVTGQAMVRQDGISIIVADYEYLGGGSRSLAAPTTATASGQECPSHTTASGQECPSHDGGDGRGRGTGPRPPTETATASGQECPSHDGNGGTGETPVLREADEAGLSLGRIVPMYPLKAGLSQRVMRFLVSQALEVCSEQAEGVVPAGLVAERGLQPLGEALRELHFPTDENTCAQARGRIAYEELFALQVALARRKLEAGRPEAGAQLPAHGLLEGFTQALPFAPTGAQARVMAEIAEDLERPAAANRLIHGDVGSGKTVCAAFALYAAAQAGRQGALMAPTELLAEQHHRTLSNLLKPLGAECRLLTGSMSEADKRAARQRIAAGQDAVVVGTHALFQQSVVFNDLAVAITDEQHRFGVRQRAGLSAKGVRPNVFVMSATPIPRTLALTAYGDFDVSVVDEMPPGRTPVLTALAWGPDRKRAFETLAARVVNGQQGYIVCPLIERDEEDDQIASAEGEYNRLQAGIYASLKLGLLHGRLDSAESETTMRRFRDGEIEILVATTVIEVGVDVPNATVMLIQNAERFGLAQLHQLRGRVGRGEQEAICVLLTRAKTPEVVERLRVLEETTNGFVIAEEDLKRRGPGEMAGTRQSGLPDLRMADLVADTQTLYKAREDAFALVQEDPELARPEHGALRKALEEAERAGGEWAM